MFGNRLVNYGGAGGIRRGLIWQSGTGERPHLLPPGAGWARAHINNSFFPFTGAVPVASLCYRSYYSSRDARLHTLWYDWKSEHCDYIIDRTRYNISYDWDWFTTSQRYQQGTNNRHSHYYCSVQASNAPLYRKIDVKSTSEPLQRPGPFIFNAGISNSWYGWVTCSLQHAYSTSHSEVMPYAVLYQGWSDLPITTRISEINGIYPENDSFTYWYYESANNYYNRAWIDYASLDTFDILTIDIRPESDSYTPMTPFPVAHRMAYRLFFESSVDSQFTKIRRAGCYNRVPIPAEVITFDTQ